MPTSCTSERFRIPPAGVSAPPFRKPSTWPCTRPTIATFIGAPPGAATADLACKNRSAKISTRNLYMKGLVFCTKSWTDSCTRSCTERDAIGLLLPTCDHTRVGIAMQCNRILHRDFRLPARQKDYNRLVSRHLGIQCAHANL